MRSKVSVLALVAALALTGCATKRFSQIPQFQSNVKPGTDRGGSGNSKLKSEEIGQLLADRAAHEVELQKKFEEISNQAQVTLRGLQRKADNYSELTLGTGAVGIGAGVAAGALVVASPANIVWVTALTGIGAGAVSFQTRTALEGFSRDVVARVYNETLVKLNSHAKEFGDAAAKMRASHNDTDTSAWNTAQGQAVAALVNLQTAALLIPIATGPSDTAELKKQNEELLAALKQIQGAIEKQRGTNTNSETPPGSPGTGK